MKYFSKTMPQQFPGDDRGQEQNAFIRGKCTYTCKHEREPGHFFREGSQPPENYVFIRFLMYSVKRSSACLPVSIIHPGSLHWIPGVSEYSPGARRQPYFA